MNISIKNLTKLYGQQKAVDDISFEVKTGEILGFLGPNGAGKTTTMKAITGYLSFNKGDITVGNYSISENKEEVKKMIGYLPENNPLYLEMPIIEYLKYIAKLQNIRPDKINSRIQEMITVCGLTDEKHKKINELSKGYRQRVGLAQALIHDPDVLILDEPTTGLDPNQIVEIRELIKKIGREKTVILSSHILAEVEATCDRILIINKGKIVANGTAEELRKAKKGNELVKIVVEDADKNEVVKSLQELNGVDMVDINGNYIEVQSSSEQSITRDIFKLCVKNSWVLTQMTPVETNLEDIFRELTTKN